MPSAKSKKSRAPQTRVNPRAAAMPSEPPEVVDPRWILKALLAVLAVGVFCAYLTLCALFYSAQWQFVLSPSRTVPQTPSTQNLAFEPVRFSTDLAGKPQLTGWWIPSDSAADPTVLVLHGQDGSMSDTLPALHALHNARLNVFVFDYRGFGESAGRHPTQASMREDSRHALSYLIGTRHLQPTNILVYGSGLGASLAVPLCQDHAQLPGLILNAADGDTLTRVLADARSRILPVRLLFHERFPLADPLAHLRTPKLLVSYTLAGPPVEVQRAADPKLTIELPAHASPALLTAAIRRFLDTYIAHPPAQI